MPAAARVGDLVRQTAPHCHAPIHPAAPVPVPCAHPAVPLPLIKGDATVLIAGRPAARLGDISAPCVMPGCLPGGPGVVSAASSSVLIGGLPAARVGDSTTHAACIAPIPAPAGRIQSPGCPTVMIGG